MAKARIFAIAVLVMMVLCVVALRRRGISFNGVVVAGGGGGSWDMVRQPSKVTGKRYLVRDVPGRALVADRLARLEVAVKSLLDAIDAQFPDDPRIERIRTRWNGTLSEIARPGDIAYSVNKKTIHMCVRDPESGYLEPYNSTMYVLIHELAHVATDTWGHPPEFWKNFRYLLEACEHLGMIEYQDFRKAKVMHCGRRLGGHVLECVRDNKCPSTLRHTSR